MVLRSQFLIDLKEPFETPQHKWQKDLVEITEEAGESVLDESLEILSYVSRGQELFVYQSLTIWGDQVATYTVRESIKKRLHRLLWQVDEFPLITTPARVAQAYWRCVDSLRKLGVPPGESPHDVLLFKQIEREWLNLSRDQAH